MTITDPEFELPELSCPKTKLAPGAKLTCTATRTVTEGDAAARSVETTAEVQVKRLRGSKIRQTETFSLPTR